MALAAVCVSVCLYILDLVLVAVPSFDSRPLACLQAPFCVLLTVTDLYTNTNYCMSYILADVERGSCSADEENWSNDMGDSQEFVETPYIPGSLVWAKMDSYPW